MRRSRARSGGRHAHAWVLVVALVGCSHDADSGKRGSTSSLAASAAKGPSGKGAKATDSPREANIIDFVAASDDCTFGHRGVLLDLGDPSMRARMNGARLIRPDVDIREHEGASWASVRSRALELSFVSSSEIKSETGIVVEARVRGGIAKSISVYLNGKPVGALSLTKGETTIASTHALGVIAKGTNELTLRFNGGPRSQHDELAEIDWVRVGPNDGEGPYSAPTRGDAITTVSIAGAARRAVSLRAPGFALCTAWVPNGSVLEGFVGATGGEAEAEVRVLVDRSEPRVVGSFHLGGSNDPPGWRPVSLPLGDVGTIAGVELVAKSSTKGARIAFAEARLVPKTDVGEVTSDVVVPKARGVILVVLGSIARSRVGGHDSTNGTPMPELMNLANTGIVFEAHRANSSLASGALGSMLSGLSPREHGASDADSAMSPSVFTVAEAARQAGIVTAMFTANPTTSALYGFSRGWETFVTRLPGEQGLATDIFEDVGRWLEAHKDDRFFVVLHARGGHPPWDVTSEELKDLPPSNYQGSLEPKHAGEALAKARKAGPRAFADPDRERAFALHAKALAAHDAALGALIARLHTIGRDKDTAWVVTGDVGIDAASRVPFLDDESVEEGALSVPLILRAPAPEWRPRERVHTATNGVDVAPTILDALGLPPPPELRGTSLWALAARGKIAPERPLIAATTTRFSARWGSFALVGAHERETKLCNLALDPDCASDVRPSHPLAAGALHALTWAELVIKGTPKNSSSGTSFKGGNSGFTSSSVNVQAADAPTSAALRAWGR